MCEQAGGNPVSTQKAIKERVMKVAGSLIEEDKKRILKMIESGENFVLTIDEWTSNDTRRFMDVTLHLSKEETLNLGLARITGSATAENLVKVMNSKLDQFGLANEKDIVGVNTNGARAMLKFGRLLK